MKLTRYTISLAMAMLALAAKSQDLSTEITVDRTVLPEQRQASRPSLLPSLLSIENQDVRLTPAEYSQSGSVTSLLTTLPAAQWGSSISRTPYRGYVSASYFPKLNLNINAGYRILDSEKLTVGVWAQGIATRYRYAGILIERGFANVGAYGSYRVDDHSQVGAEIGYQRSAIGHPLNRDGRVDCSWNDYYQGKLAWYSKPSQISYNVSVGYDCFNMDKLNMSDNPVYSASKRYNYDASLGQSAIDAAAGVGMCRDGEDMRWLGLDVDATWLSTNHGVGNQGQYHVNPYFRWTNGDVTANLGVTLSLGSGDDDSNTRIAPNVRLAYAPQGSLISAWVSFTGAENLNKLYDMYNINPYISPYRAYGRTNVPLDIEGAVSVGRFFGVNVEVFGGYALGRNIMLPMLWRLAPGTDYDKETSLNVGEQWLSVFGGPTMQGYDADCWHAGVKLSYAFRNLVEIEASAETAGSNYDENNLPVTWINWQDRAKYVVNAKAAVTPIEKLRLEVSYEYRNDRHLPVYDGKWREIDLQDAIELNFGATYKINSQFTVFAHLENLLDRYYLDCASLPSQGIHGLVGVTFKF